MFVNPTQQVKPVSAPQTTDVGMREFSGNIQDNLFSLFQVAHDHEVSATDKAAYAALTTDAQRIAFIASYLGLS